MSMRLASQTFPHKCYILSGYIAYERNYNILANAGWYMYSRTFYGLQLNDMKMIGAPCTVHSNVQCCSLLKLSFSLPLQFSLKLQILYMFPCVFLSFFLVSVALYFELLANSMFDMAVVSRCIGWNVYIWSSFYVHHTYNQVKTNGKVVEKRRTWSVWNDFFGIPTANSQIIWFKKISYVCHTVNVFVVVEIPM